MKILFLGDIVGDSGCIAVKKHLKTIIEKNKIEFVIANGENAAINGVGITEDILKDLFNYGINVVTTGNHVWDHKETLGLVEKENRLLRPLNLIGNSPGKGFNIFNFSKNFKICVLNLMGNVFMKKSEDVFKISENFMKLHTLKKNYDFLVVDIHCETTSEKMAMGHFFDGKATFVVGTHTHVPTSDTMILKEGTAYQTDAGMCGDYNSVIGMQKEVPINRFLGKISKERLKPANGEATICGVVIETYETTGLAKKITPLRFGGKLIEKWPS